MASAIGVSLDKERNVTDGTMQPTAGARKAPAAPATAGVVSLVLFVAPCGAQVAANRPASAHDATTTWPTSACRHACWRSTGCHGKYGAMR
jgi:hypothetical protein